MKKEVLFSLSFILLVACQGAKDSSSSLQNNFSSAFTTENTNTNGTTSKETISSNSKLTTSSTEIESSSGELTSSIDSLSSSNESASYSQESSSFEDEQTPKDRHDFYLEYSKVSKDVAIPIQGKFIGYEQYPNNPNCNAWFQEGKYGYYVINLPFKDVQLGKSYYIYGLSLERDYYGINAKTDYYYCVEEVKGFETETINLNNEIPENDDYIGSKVSLNGTVKSITDNVFTIEVNNTTYSISYNKSVISASKIASVYSSIKVGSNISLEGILHATNREIRIVNAADIRIM